MLELTGPRPLWQGAGHDGLLTLPSGGTQPVMVLLGPRTTASDGLARARKAARVALTLRHPGIARLVSVTQHEDRVAWCYERVDGVGLVHLAGRDDASGLSARATAELVAQVAEVLLALGGPGLHHPGPQPSDLILQPDGHVRILGFSGPYPQDPSMRPPHADAVEPGSVYRLGVLLAALLGGTNPAPPTDASAHEVLVRRALIRAMSRPGPVLSDRYGQWIRHMLAWAPAERPPLSAVPAGLRSVGWATGGAGLSDWAAQSLPEISASILTRSRDDAVLPLHDDPSDPGMLRSIAEAGPPPPRPRRGNTPTPGSFTDPTVERPDDDDTQEATFDPEEAPPRPPRRSTRPDTIPVDIGPPAEALKKRPPSLPRGFLEPDEAEQEVSDEAVTLPPVATPWWRMDRRLAFGWGGLALGLLILAGVFLVYLCSGPPAASPEQGPVPRLRDALAPGPTGVAPERAAPLVPAPDAFGGVDSDLIGDTDAPGDTDPPADAEVGQGAAADTAMRAPRGPDEVSVLFRIAGGQRGKIFVSCEPTVVTQQGWQQVRLTLRKGDVCEVGTWGPNGQQLRVREVPVNDYATVDCFRNWEPTCVQ